MFTLDMTFLYTENIDRLFTDINFLYTENIDILCIMHTNIDIERNM
jgi:hypothetical protein